MRTRFFAVTLLASLLSQSALATEPTGFQLPEATISSVHHAIKSGQLTCEKLVTAYIDRIKTYNLSAKSQPPINAITEINPSALAEARMLDKKFTKTKKLAGSLHCIPVILKDNIDSYDTTTTSGSFSLLGSRPNRDAFIVKKLREAGAIVLAKGGMDEFAWGLNGISSRNGRIGNAYNTSQSPGGSSGGPAAAVSANFAMLGIGTDNSGSVRIPSAFNGLVGLRPSRGMVSQHGLFPMGNLDGTAGPIARTVKDMAILLAVISQQDAYDKKTLDIPREQSYTKYLNKDGLKGKRIAIVRLVSERDTFKDMPPYENKILLDTFDKMRKLGATLIDIKLKDFDSNRNDNQTGEIEDINDYLASYPATRKNFQDICNSDRTNTFGGQKKCLKLMKDIKSRESKIYKKVLNIFSKNKNYLHKVMDENKLDAFLVPVSTHGSATYDAYTVNTWLAPLSSNSGLPAIEFIAGYTPTNMPVGIELVGRQYDEGQLIEMAYAYEQNSNKRLAPKMPAPDHVLAKLTVTQTNGLYTLLGAETYKSVLIYKEPDQDLPDLLTPDIFQQIASSKIEEYKKMIFPDKQS